MIEAVVFDFDGTLVDTIDADIYCRRSYLSQHQ